MRLYKAKIEKSKGGTPQKVPGAAKGAVLVQAVFYSGKKLQERLVLYDGDGDQFMYSIPGSQLPRPVSPEVATLVKLPLHYLDTDSGGDNEIVIFGELHETTKTDL